MCLQEKMRKDFNKNCKNRILLLFSLHYTLNGPCTKHKTRFRIGKFLNEIGDFLEILVNSKALIKSGKIKRRFGSFLEAFLELFVKT